MGYRGKLREQERARELRAQNRRSSRQASGCTRGEGAKRDGVVVFANSDPAMILFFCRWVRRFFDLDETKFRLSVYLHQGLDLDAAETFWSNLTGVPRQQFLKAYRAVPNPSIRVNTSTSSAAPT